MNVRVVPLIAVFLLSSMALLPTASAAPLAAPQEVVASVPAAVSAAPVGKPTNIRVNRRADGSIVVRWNSTRADTSNWLVEYAEMKPDGTRGLEGFLEIKGSKPYLRIPASIAKKSKGSTMYLSIMGVRGDRSSRVVPTSFVI